MSATSLTAERGNGMKTKDRFCLYIRFAHRNGQSLDEQKEQLRQWAIKRGFHIEAETRRGSNVDTHRDHSDVICLSDGVTSYLFATRFRA